jgi:hypothetical protein
MDDAVWNHAVFSKNRGRLLTSEVAQRFCARYKERQATPQQPRPQTTRHRGYAISLSRRWLVEKGFGWLKQTGPLRQVKLRGLEKVDWTFVFSCAAHNLIRLPRLIVERHEGRLRESCV